ncbi:MAG TPA: TMEM175 family protein [Candidatus Dormibacteraeota bacterium]
MTDGVEAESAAEEHGHASELTRIEAFSDGVMAVLITILAFELRPPTAPTWDALVAQLPGLLVYVLSFAFIGIYWNNHHHLLRTARHVSGAVMWANLHLLFWLSLIPVLTLWLRAAYSSPLPAATYGVVGLITGAAYRILVVALIQANGRDSALARGVGSDVKGIASLVIYALGVAAAFVTPYIAYAFYAAVAMMWFIPDRRLAPTAAHRH